MLPTNLSEVLSIIFVLFSGIGFFLSLWIIIPAPTFSLLPLGVGAPEMSPWLILLNAIAFFNYPAITFTITHSGRGQISNLNFSPSLILFPII